MTTPSTRTTHPLLLAAAVAVVLFCCVGIAAMLGWLPGWRGASDTPPAYASASGESGSSQLAAASLARDAAPAGGAAYPPGYQSGPAPSPARDSAPLAREPEPQRLADTAPPAPAVCKSCGVVESVREVTTRAQGTGVGAGVGAVVGGLLGNQIGGGHGRQLATVAGAVGGGVVGNQVEGNLRATRSYTIVVRMEDGSKRTFQRSSADWHAGERVRVVKGELRKG